MNYVYFDLGLAYVWLRQFLGEDSVLNIARLELDLVDDGKVDLLSNARHDF